MANPLLDALEKLGQFMQQTPGGPGLPSTAGQQPIQGPQVSPISVGNPTGFDIGQFMNTPTPASQSNIQGGVSVGVPPPPIPQPASLDIERAVDSTETQIPITETPVNPPQPDKKGGIPPELLNLLIAGGVAGLGSAVPGALAGAAGFQTGFASQTEKLRGEELAAGEVQRKEETELVRKQAETDKINAEIDKLNRGEKITGADLKNALKALGPFKGKQKKELIDKFLKQFKESDTGGQIQTATDASGRKAVSTDGGKTWTVLEGEDGST